MDLSVKGEPATISELLTCGAEAFTDECALADADLVLSYAELDHVVHASAAWWRDHGLEVGDRVAVWAVNTVECAVAMLGVVVAGGVLVPLNTRYTPREVGAMLRAAACRVLLTPERVLHRDLAVEARQVVHALTDPPRVLHLAAGEPSGTPACRELRAAPRHVDVRRAPDDLVTIQFTSGSSGHPKGVRLRQTPLVRSAGAWASIAGVRRGDRFPLAYPLSHVGGFKTGIVSPLHRGAAVLLTEVVSRTSLVELVREAEPTFLSAPPTAQAYVVDAHRAGELTTPTTIRTCVIGSASVPPTLVRDLLEVVGVDHVVIGYGLTEATGVCTMTRPTDPPEVACTSVGRPIPSVEVRIASEDGVPLEPGQMGHVEVKGPTVMAGYVDADDADVVRPGGWLRTGDLGWVDGAGNLRLAGRSRNLVIVGGFNVHPAEVEHCILDHPAVAECAVLGVPDERLGEVPVAFVVLREPASPEELTHWARARLANFKVPRHVWTVEDLPRGAVDKIDRATLSEWARQRTAVSP